MAKQDTIFGCQIQCKGRIKSYGSWSVKNIMVENIFERAWV